VGSLRFSGRTSLKFVRVVTLTRLAGMKVLGRRRYTWREYLSLERDANLRHESFDGEILAIAGGSPEHAALATGMIRELGAQLKGKRCRVHTSDLRIRVLATGLGTYPDVAVVCGDFQYDPEDKETVVNPTVIVEVLSSSTENYDRGEKFENYKQIPSLKEYVLVSHRERMIEVFRRADRGDWTRTEARSTAFAKIDSLGCAVAVVATSDRGFGEWRPKSASPQRHERCSMERDVHCALNSAACDEE
jgi:Uma2 family endonuclease